MLSMLRHLNDTHVCLQDGMRRIGAGLFDEIPRDQFSFDLVVSKYLGGESATELGGRITYGRPCKEIGYGYKGDFKKRPGETAAAIAILEICRSEFPQVAMIYGQLAAAYMNSGDAEAAGTVVEEGESLKEFFPGEKSLLERVKAALEEG